MNLREAIEADLEESLEGEWGLPVILIGPEDSGETQEVKGQILYDTVEENPETGGTVMIHNPVVTIRRSSLNPVPEPGDRWAVRIPIEPREDAPKRTFVLDHPSQEGASIGFIRLYLGVIQQET